MYNIFTTITQMSMTASAVILAVLLARILLQKMPKIFSYILWAIVLFRLLCPVTFSSAISVFQIFEQPEINREIEHVDYIVEEFPEEAVTFSATPIEEVEHTFIPNEAEAPKAPVWQNVLPVIWLLGVTGLIVYGFVSCFGLKKRVIISLQERDNIYLCDYITTPFVLGVIRPRIYLPSSLTEEEKEYIVLHEQIHIKRGDHIFRLLAYLALSLHWFNPLVWIAFRVSGMDMEMSCDEAVMKKSGKDIRTEYATSLLSMAAGKKCFTGTFLAFGEDNTKSRIKNIMNYKSHAVIFIAAATVMVGVLAVALGSDPQTEETLSSGVMRENWNEVEIVAETENYIAKQENTFVQQNQTENQNGQGTYEEDTLQDIGEQQTVIREQVTVWAEAFCKRDGGTIRTLSSPLLAGAMEQEGILAGSGNGTNFGWSSPWPWDDKKDYRILETTENTATILYYAWVSDPHVTVWKEEIQFQNEGEFQVVGSRLEFLDNISNSREFLEAYSNGINNTPMDYLTNGAGEVLNQRAKEVKNDEAYSLSYRQLFEPIKAANYLLNINPELAQVEVSEIQADGSVVLQYRMNGQAAETRLHEIKMIQPYGTDGIWIPQDYQIEEVKAERIDYYEDMKQMHGDNFLEEYYELVYTTEITAAGSGMKQIIEVYTGNIGDGDSGFVLIKDEEGNLLYNEFAHRARMGWNNVFLAPRQGWLMTLYIDDRDDSGTYSYQVYSITDVNIKKIWQEDEFSFDDSVEPHSEEDFMKFYELFQKLPQSTLLLSTQGGELRAKGLSEEEYRFIDLMEEHYLWLEYE